MKISVKEHSWLDYFRFLRAGITVAFGNSILFGGGSALVAMSYFGSFAPSKGLLVIGEMLIAAGVITNIAIGYAEEKDRKERSNVFLEVLDEHIEGAKDAESGLYKWKRDLLQIIKEEAIVRSQGYSEGDKSA